MPLLNRISIVLLLWACVAGSPSSGLAEGLRPPAVPLITHDPYFSIWSMNDRLTDDWPKHWTGATNAMLSMIRIDGKPYRIMGSLPDAVPALPQVDLDVSLTRTTYTFEGAGVQVEMFFLSPLLIHDIQLLSRPVSYLTWRVRSVDEKLHEVALYFDISGEWTVNRASQEIEWNRMIVGGMDVLRMGTAEQPILEKQGDRLCIDWGYGYLAVPKGPHRAAVITSDRAARGQFAEQGRLPDTDDMAMPRPVERNWPVMACAFDCGTVGSEPVSRFIALAYDDLYSIEYLHRRLRPFWRAEFNSIQDVLHTAVREYEDVHQKAAAFDDELHADLVKVGGEKFAYICTLAYRQCLAAHKVAMDFDGTPLHFSKECYSNGCIATVDVTYPASPFFLLFNTELLKGQMIPILEYAQSKRWKFPFAPHDLGTYPKANRQAYGGGEDSEENQMPIEETGNMLLMITGIAQVEGNADFAKQYWPLLTQWAEYLKEQGLDPANQLCTDDFAGHLAHNANLSIKAIMALGGYSLLCKELGYTAEAREYHALAKSMAKKWMALADDGDHYRLAFDMSGTWSQKYNLVWDELYGLNLFPKSVVAKEMAYYKTVMNPYGLPLDNRSKYTKTDWEMWTATLTESKEDFALFVDPIYDFLQDTPDRVPFTDWYWTHDAKKRGFQHRSVIGGVFIPMLKDGELWKKWSRKSMP